MNRLKKQLLISGIFMLTLLSGKLFAQGNCPQQPALCPDEGSINETMDAVNRMKNKDVFPQEIGMENQLRNTLTNLAQTVAKENGWQVYELNEQGTSGPPFIFISYDTWEATPFDKRPPHQYQISFVFLINKDSLTAWRNWLLNDIQQQETAAAGQYNASQNNPLLLQYQDSINHYTQLYTDFLQNNNDQHLKDIQSNNQKGLDKYDHRQKAMMDKIDYFQQKIETIQQQDNSGFDALNNEMNQKTVAFAEGSMAIIHFYINPYKADFALQNAEQVNILPQKTITIPHAFYAGITANNAPPDRHNYELNYRGFVFNNPSSIATVLFGHYLPKDSYNYYPAVFSKSFNNRPGVIGMIKTISCDKVQNIAVHIEGSDQTVNMIVHSLDWEKIFGLLYE